ncbi:MAG: tetratricopeptide repeat protein [Chloroflexota bacterium]
MDSVESTSLNEFSDEERRGRRRMLAQHAITLAVQSRWQEAADVNQQIVEIVPDDSEAFNRLGKAFTELGRISEAREAYQRSLNADPANLIAQRNLDRLSRITESEAGELAKQAQLKLDPRFFMEETGKTGLTILENPAPSKVLATLTAGLQVKVAVQDGSLTVTTMDGVYIGSVDQRLGARLIRLMGTGNEYQAGIVGVDEDAVRVIIREIRQSPENAGRISFPPQRSQDALPRPYLREGLRRRVSASEEDDDEDLDLDVDADAEDDEEDTSEFGFHESTLDEA